MIGTHTKINNLRWFIFIPVALLAFFSTNAQAQPITGINAVYYVIPDVPPSKTDNTYQSCGSEIENNINRSFDGEPMIGCPDDLFMVHYTGFITLPAHNTIQFWLAADDGGTMKIGDYEWGDWSDKGCSAIETEPMTMPSNQSLTLDGWYYENGGGTCLMMAWNIDGAGWEMVPDEAFTTNPYQMTTTTATTTVPITTTSTTTSTTTTTTTTSTTTTTQVPTTTSSSSTTTTTEQPTTTTTSLPETQTTHQVQTTVLQTTTTVEQPEKQVDNPIVTNPPVTTSVPAPVLSVRSTTSVPVATIPTTTLPEVASSTSVPIQEPPLETPTEIVNNQIIELLTNIDTASQEEIQAVVTEILAAEITPDQAIELATSAAVLESVSAEEAQQIFEAIDLETLEPAQLEELIAVVQNASDTVRKSFETAINVFDGKTDTYVPLGSTVPISTRRLVVAVGAMLSAVPTASRKQK